MIALADNAIVAARERETLRLQARLKDDAGVTLPPSAIETWTLTLYCKDDPEQSVINGREDLALITDGVVNASLASFFTYTEDEPDVWTARWVFPPEDQKILTCRNETHICQFTIVTIAASPAVGDTIHPKFTIEVENLGRVG